MPAYSRTVPVGIGAGSPGVTRTPMDSGAPMVARNGAASETLGGASSITLDNELVDRTRAGALVRRIAAVARLEHVVVDGQVPST